jgi:hypothetical protein
MIPASGSWEGAIDFVFCLSTGEEVTIDATRITIQLHGEPRYIEEFKGNAGNG